MDNPNKYFFYDGKIVQPNEKELAQYFIDAEIKLRTGKLNYREHPVTKEQILKIKETWIPELQSKLKENMGKVKTQEKPTLSDVHVALFKTLEEAIVMKRAEKKSVYKIPSNNSIAYQTRLVSADCNLSALFKCAPDTSDEYAPRQYYKDGPIVDIRCTTNLKHLVVEKSKVDRAAVYIVATWLKGIQQSRLIGWASKNDILKAPVGNRFNNPDDCSWNEDSYYFDCEKLHPMKDILLKLNRDNPEVYSNFPPYVLFETFDKDKIPMETKIENCLPTNAIERGDNFYDILG